ncbi:hypothetical protein DPMN_140774 [Dreissena polymorpha]|uniref:Uncharacterized protein n=1 Tax=Dreissena polymorpha TaxID=45954 RepID=A0A9D4JJB1_DREPO|nr:hypothetical protein DPMN_140774 [Dreissena polymorpha]
MPPRIYEALIGNSVSWECIQCGIPNFHSGLFDLTLYELANSCELLNTEHSRMFKHDISFNIPRATSSPNRGERLSSSGSNRPNISDSEQFDISSNISHPSITRDGKLQFIQVRKRNRKNDIPLISVVINRQSIVDKKASLHCLTESM